VASFDLPTVLLIFSSNSNINRCSSTLEEVTCIVGLFAMNRKIALSLIFVLIVTLFSCAESALAEGTVGVSVGQSTEYTYAFSGTERFSNGTLNSSVPFDVGYIETITIQDISGTNVTIEVTRTQRDGTKETGNWWIDVSTGDGTATGVIISANRNAGEMAYPDWVNNESTTEGADIINETITMKLGETFIEVNHFEIMYTVDNQSTYWDYYWEKSTGLLVKFTIMGTEVDEEGTTLYLNYQQQRVGLQHVFYPLIDSADYPVTVDSNSAILNFEFNQTERKLSLNVTGTTGTGGFCDVAVPSSLVWGTFTLSMDDYPLAEGTDYTQTYNGTHYIFHISYIHSTHTIEILGSDAIPEFPTVMIASIFMAATLMAAIVYRRRLNQTTH